MAADTRQRMVQAAAQLLRTKGVAGTSFTDVLSICGAARGAIYHHFPGGKAELTRDAVAWTGDVVQAQLGALPGESPQEIVTTFVAAVRPVVAQSAAGAGCAVAAATVECASADDLLAGTARRAFGSWVDVLERRLLDAGADAAAAASLSTLMVVFLEGAHVLCRAEGGLGPFDRAAAGVLAAGRVLLAPAG